MVRGRYDRQSHCFEYEDGTPCYPVAAAAYVWELQREEPQKQTTAPETPRNQSRWLTEQNPAIRIGDNL